MVYNISIGLLLAIPWVLFGVVFIGAASSAVGRWMGHRRRPYQVGARRRPMTSRAKGGVHQAAMRMGQAETPRALAQRSSGQGGQVDQRRAV